MTQELISKSIIHLIFTLVLIAKIPMVSIFKYGHMILLRVMKYLL